MLLHRDIRPTLLTLAVLTGALMSPSSAGAGQLTEILCADAATGKGVGSIAPELSNPNSVGGLGLMTADSDCTGDITSAKGIVLRPYPGHYADNQWGAIAYDAPPDLTLSGAQLWRAFTAPAPTTHFMMSQEAVAASDIGGQPWSERYDWTWGQDGSAGSPSAPFASANTHGLATMNGHWYVHMRCDSQGSTGCDIASGSEYRIFGGRIRLVDASDPATIGPMSGPIVSVPVLHGDQDIAFSATDVGAGLYRGIVSLDGAQVATRVIDDNGGHCADVNPANTDPYEFDRGVPCQPSASVTLTFDTTSWPEGTHTLTFAVEDAAGNRTTAVNRAVTIDNVPAPAVTVPPVVKGKAGEGDVLVTDLGTWTGGGIQYATRWQRSADAGWIDIAGATATTYLLAGGDVAHRVRSCVVATNGEGSAEACSAPTSVVEGPPATPRQSTAPAVVAVALPAPGGAAGPPAGATHAVNGEGGGAGVRMTAFGRGQTQSIVVPYGRRATVTGRLVGPSGDPVRGAVLDVAVGTRLAGARMASAGQVMTDGEGVFHYTAPAGPSRLVRFGYRVHLDDTDVTQTTDVTVSVRAGVSLRLDHKTLRNGRTLRYLGRLLGPHASGKIVDVQVRNGRGWTLVCSVKTRSNGAFSCSHRFLRTFSPTRYVFRARARAQSAFPYLTGTSKLVSVRVVP